MPYGTGLVVRSAFIKAKPWQRYVIAIVMIAGGAVLAVFGHLAGALLSIGGIILFSRMLRARHGALMVRRHHDRGDT